MSLEKSAAKLLLLLAKKREMVPERPEIDGPALADISGLPPHDINDAIALLGRSRYVEWHNILGSEPFDFGEVWITPIGRYEAERISGALEEPLSLAKGAVADAGVKSPITLPATPIGSPYGFHDEDWRIIADRKGRSDQLNVVLGYQFKSEHYDSALLQANIAASFERAVETYNMQAGALPTTFVFRSLAAGYGEHLFNEIARDIIASDIAVFDTSDLNPNVMLELGVALTWGIRVLPIKLQSQRKPPSDISGQTWADYEDSGSRFVDAEHDAKLVRMVDRAMRKKGRT